jgi:hypothetical protein
MNAKIIRDEKGIEGDFGKLYFDDIYFCETLQPDMVDVGRFHLPIGSYICKRWHSEKHPNTFEIVCPPHVAVLFHSGNVVENSLGCCLLGETRGKLGAERAILNSGATFKKFLDKTKDVNEFQLTVEDNYGTT